MGVMSEDGMGLNSETAIASEIENTILTTPIGLSPSKSTIEQLNTFENIDKFLLIHVKDKSFFVPKDQEYRADKRRGNLFTCQYNPLIFDGTKFTKEQAEAYRKLLPDTEFCGISCFIEDCPAYIKTKGYNTNSQ